MDLVLKIYWRQIALPVAMILGVMSVQRQLALAFNQQNDCALYFTGQYNRTVKDPHQREYNVISVRIHKKYMTEIYDYGFDIALLKLARHAFSVLGKIGTACLPPQSERVPVGKNCYITGRIYIKHIAIKIYFFIHAVLNSINSLAFSLVIWDPKRVFFFLYINVMKYFTLRTD